MVQGHFKANLAQRVTEASAKAEQAAEAAKAAGQPSVVLGLEIAADGKVAKKLQDQMRAIHPSGSFFIASLDEDSER